jgi:hypothetical protein
MGAGKSYVAVNWVLLDELKNGKRDVYTTLPVNIDNIAIMVGGKSPAKQRAVVERIHILEDKEKQPVDAEGKPMMKKARIKVGDEWTERETDQPLMLNEARCFWRFTKPNSLIIVDECADYWEAGKADNKKLGVEEGEFGVYLRQHRHYKDDLWMICHNLSDIDPQLRRKFHFVWTVANSRNEPIVNNKWFRNIRWPIQFFIVRQYTAADTKKPMDTHHVNPVPRGYELYDSFSAASRLPGKEMPPEEARSADYKPSFMKRVWEFVRACRKVATLAAFVIGGGYIALTWILFPALGFGESAVQTKSRQIAHRTSTRPAPALPDSATPATAVMVLPQPAAGIASSGDSVAVDGLETTGTGNVPPPAPKTLVRVIFRSPRFVQYSDGVRLIVDEVYADKKITSIDGVGVHFDDGTLICHGEHRDVAEFQFRAYRDPEPERGDVQPATAAEHDRRDHGRGHGNPPTGYREPPTRPE